MGAKRGVAVLWACLAVSAAGCGRSPTSVGLVYGDPTGIAFRHVMDRTSAVSAALGLSALEADVAHGYVDYTMCFNSIRRGDFNPYWGVGLAYAAWVGADEADDDVIGFAVRVPLGISYEFGDGTGDLFAQVALYLGALDGFSLAIGARFGM